MNAITITEVDKKHQGMAITPLIDLFHNADGDPNIKGETTFRVKVFIPRIDPSDVKEWVKGIDKKTKKFVTLKASNAGAQNLGYHIQLLCKDISTQSNSNVYKFMLCSSQDSQKDDPVT
jgi:hypothetical protein